MNLFGLQELCGDYLYISGWTGSQHATTVVAIEEGHITIGGKQEPHQD